MTSASSLHAPVGEHGTCHLLQHPSSIQRDDRESHAPRSNRCAQTFRRCRFNRVRAWSSGCGSGISQRTPEEDPLYGQSIFRFDTFGDEQLWTGMLRMHEAISRVPPATALAVGLKVDVEALPSVSHCRASRPVKLTSRIPR